MNKEILVPVDFSKKSINALNYAVELAKKEKAELILLHVFSLLALTPPVASAYKMFKTVSLEPEVAIQNLEKLCTEIKKSKKIICRYITADGPAVEAIADVEKKRNPYLLVMGTDGASGVKEVLLGSHTAKIIETCRCPVIAVPHYTLYKKINSIVFATDYRESEFPEILSLVEIAKPFESKIILLHVAPAKDLAFFEDGVQESFKDKLRKKTHYKQIEFQLKDTKGDTVERALDDFLLKNKIDLIAFCTKRRNLLEKITEVSLTKEMAYHSETPVLAFHSKD